MGFGSHHCPSGSLNWMDRTPNTPVNNENSPKFDKYKVVRVKEEKIKCDNCHSYILYCNLTRHKNSKKCKNYNKSESS